MMAMGERPASNCLVFSATNPGRDWDRGPSRLCRNQRFVNHQEKYLGEFVLFPSQENANMGL